MNGDGVRPRKLWHWGAIALMGATVWHNPSGSAEFAVTVLDGAGTIFGGALEPGRVRRRVRLLHRAN